MEIKLMKGVCGVLIIALLFVALKDGKERYKLYQLEKAEHGVDTMTVMKGVYEDNGLILTENGHEWIYIWDTPLKANTEVQVIFQTYDKPIEEWEIVEVVEL